MQDRAGRAVPVAEAAARLGLRPETLRKQLARGRAPGLKRHGQWFAVLDDVLDVQDHAGHDAGPPTEPVPHAASDVPPVQDHVQDGAGPAAVVAVLEAEIALLTAELERVHERLREAHVLLAQRPALPAPSVTISASVANLPPWWSWRRWAGWRW